MPLFSSVNAFVLKQEKRAETSLPQPSNILSYDVALLLSRH